MENAKLGKGTLELMGMVGALYDLTEQYLAYEKRENPEACKIVDVYDALTQKTSEAFEPAITFLEDIIHERLTDFMGSTDTTEI